MSLHTILGIFLATMTLETSVFTSYILFTHISFPIYKKLLYNICMIVNVKMCILYNANIYFM